MPPRDDKASRLLVAGRVRILTADEDAVTASVKGDSAEYRVSVYRHEEYGMVRECNCTYHLHHPARGDCSHVLAVERVWREESR